MFFASGIHGNKRERKKLISLRTHAVIKRVRKIEHKLVRSWNLSKARLMKLELSYMQTCSLLEKKMGKIRMNGKVCPVLVSLMFDAALSRQTSR